jgi:hypothetical protein
VVGIVVGILSLIALGLLAWYLVRRKRMAAAADASPSGGAADREAGLLTRDKHPDEEMNGGAAPHTHMMGGGAGGHPLPGALNPATTPGALPGGFALVQPRAVLQSMDIPGLHPAVSYAWS